MLTTCIVKIHLPKKMSKLIFIRGFYLYLELKENGKK